MANQSMLNMTIKAIIHFNFIEDSGTQQQRVTLKNQKRKLSFTFRKASQNALNSLDIKLL